MANRLSALRSALEQQGLEAIIIESQVNRQYITNFTGSTGWAVITGKDAFFVTDFRYIEQATAECEGFEVVNNDRKALETIYGVLKQSSVNRVAFEAAHISYATYEDWKQAFTGVELVATKGLIEGLRIYKDEQELVIMREAAELADDALAHVIPMMKPSVSEQVVAAELEYYLRKNGANGSGFDIIVASGKRGALPHGRASEKLIEAGDMVTIDFGAHYKGYHSDITRTFSVGEPNAQMKDIYEIVLKAQLHAVNQVKPGMTGKEVDALCRDIITEAGYGEKFGHSTGHGLGMDVHESPAVSASSDVVLQPGMVITIEPGIYVEGLGGVRIEDDIIITEDGCEILNKTSKELMILPV
ncbi:M24 family metallopeptidase [Brevibacillus daliensis]|uniref:M24 family metallopeptidase n=1 Tax=Brevibacillus daliensis TaxID=2892995 RepID=UPI001E439E94|nr:Xaa-Pro peptidase family protein [Brevibacillus daliensis]